jgi:predicted nuclease of restriction endonuclease-like (RecB) superfamily
MRRQTTGNCTTCPVATMRRSAIQYGWSRNVLVHQIESGLHRRQGKAVTNFYRTLRSPQSEVARDVIKDPYNFDIELIGGNHSTSQCKNISVND